MGTEPKLEILRDISLRDWFAGMALQGMIASNTEGLKAPDYWSRMAYNIADSMLTERSK